MTKRPKGIEVIEGAKAGEAAKVHACEGDRVMTSRVIRGRGRDWLSAP
jgi:hypothetical protein